MHRYSYGCADVFETRPCVHDLYADIVHPESETSLSAVEMLLRMTFISVASMLTLALNMLEVADRDIPLLTRIPGSKGLAAQTQCHGLPAPQYGLDWFLQGTVILIIQSVVVHWKNSKGWSRGFV
jgi:hypothetical protein